MSDMTIRLGAGQEWLLVLEDEHGKLVRVPIRSLPTLTTSSYEPSELTEILLRCRGLVVKDPDGNEQDLSFLSIAWLRSCSESEADAFLRYQGMRRR